MSVTDFQERATPAFATAPGCTHVRIPGSELQPPAVSYLVKARTWRLEQPYTFDDPEGGWHLHIADGFTFDLASIPRPAWTIAAPFELSIAAPLLHDVLYRYGGICRDYAVTHPWRSFTRLEADRLFMRIMAAEGVPVARRRLAYAAVRTFGRKAWRGQ